MVYVFLEYYQFFSFFSFYRSDIMVISYSVSALITIYEYETTKPLGGLNYEKVIDIFNVTLRIDFNTLKPNLQSL